MGKHFAKNVVIAACLAAAGFVAAYMVFLPHLTRGGSFTDGDTTLDADASLELRYAIWEAPAPMEGELNTPENERSTATSPDGRFLVFVVGERGLGTDLWIAELDARGRAVEPRPLSGVNSASDELAPSFTADGRLLFASNRPGGQGGLDLWEVPYDGGLFDVASNMGASINTPADETDPAAIPGEDGLVFASNRSPGAAQGGARGRRRDFDLYEATGRLRTEEDAPDGPRPFRVVSLDDVNSPFDERDPCLTHDGRALLFASDRSGDSARDFDLYRSVRAPRTARLAAPGEAAPRWLAPRALDGVNTVDPERAPRPSFDGFTLLYSRRVDAGEVEGGQWDVWRATSREIVRTPGRPVGWKLIAVLVALLAIALLAALAKRWSGLDIIYKALLASLILHVLLLLWSDRIVPTASTDELNQGEGPRVRVRLLEDPNSISARRNEERGGRIEASRSEAEAAEATLAELPSEEAAAETSPTAEPLERRAAEALAAAPAPVPIAQPERAEPTREAAPESLREVDVEVERKAAAAPEVAVQVDASGAEVSREAVETASPTASAPAELAADASVPEVTASAPERLSRANAEQAAAPARRDVVLERSTEVASEAGDAASALAVATPSEAFERLVADARPGVEVTTAAEAGLEATRPAAPSASARAEALPAPSGTGPALAPSAQATLQRRRGAEALALADAPAMTRADARRFVDGPVGAPDVEIAAAADALGTIERKAEDSARFDPLAGGAAETAPMERAARGAADAAPGVEAAPRVATSMVALEPGPVAAAPLERSARRSAPPGPPAFAPAAASRPLEVARDASGEAPAVAVAMPAAPDLPARTTAPEASAAPATDLAPVDMPAPLTRSRRTDAPSAPGLAAAAPGPRTPRPIDSPAPTAYDVAVPVAPTPTVVPPSPAPSPSLWDKTPYQSRTGDRKLAALEEFGGTAETEAAVAAGLRYLAGRQRANGRWGRPLMDEVDGRPKYGQVMIGKSGLALLAFMGAGHTPKSGSEYSEVVERGLAFLLGSQDPKTGHFGKTSSYGHAIATYAIGEAYALTSDERLEEPLRRAVQQIIDKQIASDDPLRDGGWTYYYGRRFRPEGASRNAFPRASIAAWQVMALESAKLGGIEVPRGVFARARRFLVNTWDPERGAFRYSHDPNRLRTDYPLLPGSTPATMFALSLLGADLKQDQFAPARRFVIEKAPKKYEFTGSDDFVFEAQGNLYFWYYGTLAMFRCGEAEWRGWNRQMKRALLPAQEPDGSWPKISIYANYAQDTNSDRVYTTAMNVLALEVYYRYFTPLLKVE